MTRGISTKSYKPACLPHPDYTLGPDRKHFIAGYGRFRRVPCETTSGGPAVSHFIKIVLTII